MNQQRVEQVIDFIRQNSTETGGIIAKGSASHIPTSFSTRCNFMIFSIDTPIKNKADESRITVLNILSPEVVSEKVRKQIDQRWGKLQEILIFLQSCHNLSQRFFARIVNSIPARIINYKTFKTIITEHFGSARLGDQLGAHMSARWTFEFDRIATVEEAKAFIATRDFTSYSQYLEVSQEQQVLNTILETILRVPTVNGQREHSIGRLISIIHKDVRDYDCLQIGDQLKDHGIKVDLNTGFLYIANKNSNLSRVLERTNVSENWGRLLERVTGAIKPANPVWFGQGGAASRCIAFPLDMILNETWMPALNEIQEMEVPAPMEVKLEPKTPEFEGIKPDVEVYQQPLTLQDTVLVEDDSLMFGDEYYNHN